MVSLTTTYIVSLALVSIAGMASAFVGHKIYPIKGGANLVPPPTPAEVSAAAAEAAEKASKLANATLEEKAVPIQQQEVSTDQPVQQIQTGQPIPDLSTELKKHVPAEMADAITKFVKTPVSEWKKIGETKDMLDATLKQAFSNLNECTEPVKDVCKIVYLKYTAMKNLIEGQSYMPYGDQTQSALDILSSTE